MFRIAQSCFSAFRYNSKLSVTHLRADNSVTLALNFLLEKALKANIVCDMVKKRVHGECTYDENGYKRRAACLVFNNDKEDQVLLITSKHYNEDKEWWLVPGGSIEPGEEPHCAAEREVFEESGVKGHIIRSLGQVVNDVKMSRTWVFVMIVKDELQQWDDKTIGRQRRWFSSDAAKKLLSIHRPVQVKYIDLARRRRGHRCHSLSDSCDMICCRQHDDSINQCIGDCSTTTAPAIPNISQHIPLQTL